MVGWLSSCAECHGPCIALVMCWSQSDEISILRMPNRFRSSRSRRTRFVLVVIVGPRLVGVLRFQGSRVGGRNGVCSNRRCGVSFGIARCDNTICHRAKYRYRPGVCSCF